MGVATWNASQFGAPEVVQVAELSGQFIIAAVPHAAQNYWITVSYDHVSSLLLRTIVT